jgi:hypothetical protein
MENVCCHGNVLTEPLASNGLVPCNGNVCLASRWPETDLFVAAASHWLAMDYRSGSAVPAFKRHVTL